MVITLSDMMMVLSVSRGNSVVSTAKMNNDPNVIYFEASISESPILFGSSIFLRLSELRSAKSRPNKYIVQSAFYIGIFGTLSKCE